MMQLWYLGGCGIYLELDNQGILIDGLYTSCKGFSKMPVALQTGILEHQEPFAKIHTLLFTHQHADHCDFRLVHQYLQKHSGTQYFIPSPNTIVQDAWEKDGIYAFPTWHLPSDTYKISHFSYFIQEGDERILILGDAYPTKCKQVLSEFQDITSIFVNPYFLKLPSGREILEKIRPKHCYVYHLPFAKDDCYGMQGLARQWQERYPESVLLIPEECVFPMKINFQ